MFTIYKIVVGITLLTRTIFILPSQNQHDDFQFAGSHSVLPVSHDCLALPLANENFALPIAHVNGLLNVNSLSVGSVLGVPT
jgi:hypothetical protein